MMNIPRPQNHPISRLQSPKAPGLFSFYIQPSFKKKTKKKQTNKNVVTLLFWQDSEPGRLVGLPYIIGDLTNILASIRLRHIEQSQHFRIGTIYPRVLEQTQESNITANPEGLRKVPPPTHRQKPPPSHLNSSTKGLWVQKEEK